MTAEEPLAVWERELLESQDYTERQNRLHRQDVAIQVLQAMDIDEYLIDAVRNARPSLPAEPVGDVVIKDRNGDLWKRAGDRWAWQGNHARVGQWVYLAANYQPLTIYRADGGGS